MRPPEQPHPGEERGARADRKRTTNRWDMESQASAKPLTAAQQTRSASADQRKNFNKERDGRHHSTVQISISKLKTMHSSNDEQASKRDENKGKQLHQAVVLEKWVWLQRGSAAEGNGKARRKSVTVPQL